MTTSQRSYRGPPHIGYLPDHVQSDLSRVAHDPARRVQVERGVVTFDSFIRNMKGFTWEVGTQLVPVEIRWLGDGGEDVPPGQDDDVRKVKVVAEIVVTPGMSNMLGILHGGCTSYLFDTITTATLITATGKPGRVSVTLSTNFIRPAPVGTRLHVVGYTASIGRSFTHLNGEIWDADSRKLVATCTHVMADVAQQPPAPSAKL